jgi:hypothetical protein
VIDLKYDNLLTVQDKVASQLISELKLSLSPSGADRLKPENPVNPLGIYGCDAEGEFIDVNQTLVLMLGYESKSELLGASSVRQASL